MRSLPVLILSLYLPGCAEPEPEPEPTAPIVDEQVVAWPAPSRAPMERASFCVEPVSQPFPAWFEAARELGVGTVGVNGVDWDRMEPQPPTSSGPRYDPRAWAALDEVVRRARAADQRLQLTIQVRSAWGTVSTESGVGAPGSSPVRPEARPAFARWLADLMDRADTNTAPILMVGNELEAPGHWNGSMERPADGAAYTELVEQAAAIRDEVAPGAIIWRASTNFGAMFDDGPDDETVEARIRAGATPEATSLLDEAFAGALPVDAFSLHPAYAPDGLLHQIRWVRERLPDGTPLVAEDVRSVPAEWPDRDAVSAGNASAVARWQAAQVEVLSQKVLLGAGAGLDVACVSTLFDFPDGYALESWHNTGLSDRDGTRRPAFEAYRLWIATLEGWTPHEPIAVQDGWIVPFRRGEARALAAWGSGEWAVPVGWGEPSLVVRPPTRAGVTDWQPVDTTDGRLVLEAVPAWVELYPEE